MPTPDREYTKDIVFPLTQLRVEIGLYKGDVTWFIVQLEYNHASDPIQLNDWRTVARFDHHPQMSWGHDIEVEGLHMDVYRDGYKKNVSHSFRDVPINNAVDFCERFFEQNADRLVDQYEEWHDLDSNYL